MTANRLQTSLAALCAASIGLFVAVFCLLAQSDSPPLVENGGKPIVLPYECTAEDVHFAGMTCSEEEPCPVYLELAAAGFAGGRTLVAGNIHTTAVTLYSVLLASDDAGITWRETHPRIRGAGLETVQFYDTANGWASGETLFPMAQDPFLLATSDGGRTWQRFPLFSDTFYGSLHDFQFTSRTSGTAIVERPGSKTQFAIYDSTDGGRTWNFRQDLERWPRQARGTEPSPWRVRAEAASQAFAVERSEGTGWKAVARFAVSLKPCQVSAR